MNGSLQRGLRRLTKIMRPVALRSAGKKGSKTSVVRHVGRHTGHSYDTPVVAAQHDLSVYVALPYGEGTDWLRNVLAKGSASMTTDGTRYDVAQPEVLPMAGATQFFGAKEQRLHRRFGVDKCVRMHRTA